MDGKLAAAAKSAARRLAAVGTTRRGSRLLGLGEMYLQILQGKGSGARWDIDGEALVAERFLRGVEEPVIFDVGANVGEWSEGVDAVLHNHAARYVLFEPASACWPQCEAIQVPNLEVVRAAVGAESGRAELMFDKPGSGGASMYERHETYFGDMTAHSEKIDVTTIDEYVEERGIERIDYLKIDVEGSEMAALQGMAKTFADSRITSIAFEFGSANIYSRHFFRDFWVLLSDHGFKFWRISPGGRVVPVLEYTEQLEHFRGVSNYVASLVEPARTQRENRWVRGRRFFRATNAQT